jgi:hypothetical protein
VVSSRYGAVCGPLGRAIRASGPVRSSSAASAASIGHSSNAGDSISSSSSRGGKGVIWDDDQQAESIARIGAAYGADCSTEAVAHPGFGVLLHFRGNEGDAIMAPWAMHTHISWEITEHELEAHTQHLRAANYQGCWSVEHHSGQHEYSEVAIQLAKVRDVLSRRELEGVAE